MVSGFFHGNESDEKWNMFTDDHDNIVKSDVATVRVRSPLAMHLNIRPTSISNFEIGSTMTMTNDSEPQDDTNIIEGDNEQDANTKGTLCGGRANWKRLKKWTRNTRPTFFIIVLPSRLDAHIENSHGEIQGQCMTVEGGG